MGHIAGNETVPHLIFHYFSGKFEPEVTSRAMVVNFTIIRLKNNDRVILRISLLRWLRPIYSISLEEEVS